MNSCPTDYANLFNRVLSAVCTVCVDVNLQNICITPNIIVTTQYISCSYLSYG